eukprot:gnl/TRDRNA2_/TRDRNA2_63131_c0_seq1.p1 gnl/TRDRNA2_/TRDRNA2_63131_c0~~gnl/TRDRNA2_/TRDRNA2_63131_c0_seq1.p1  ORF type:complete len:161 (-),score=13.56 gnl/TRDRNA2_/TRDRNA2_63131_c0_seq1:27-509(-)
MLAVEIGTQIGYSAVRIGRYLPTGAKLWTIEPNPDNANLAVANIDHAGLSDVVNVLRGKLADVSHRIPRPVDFIFLDHSRAGLLRELQDMEKRGFISNGTTIVADNVGGESKSHGGKKAQEYADYVRNSGRYSSKFHWGDDDGIEISCAGSFFDDPPFPH